MASSSTQITGQPAQIFNGSAAPSAPSAAVLSGPEEALKVASELATEFLSGAPARDADRVLPVAEVRLLSERGLTSLTVPARLGGPDVPLSVVAEVLRIIATADPNIAQIPHSHFVYVNLLRWAGSLTQQDQLLSQVLAGALFGNAQSEAGAPTPGTVRTTLRPDGHGYVIDGDKFYCTGAYFAQIIPVLANDPDGQSVVAYVPRDTPGVTIVDNWAGMGQRTTASGTVKLDGVRVGPAAVVSRAPVFAGPQTYGSFAQLMHTAIDVGIARGTLNEAVSFVQTGARPWFEAGVDRAGDDPLVIQRVGDLAVAVRAAEALLGDAGRQLDHAEAERVAGRLDAQLAAETSIAVAIAKAHADRVCVDTASALFEVCGTRSAADSLNFSRHWRNARTHTLHDPVRWKLQHIGRWTLNGTPPPSHGQI
jgi:SfnB family sulfur acquisition oxidoreductase